jgi:hypothetical protein
LLLLGSSGKNKKGSKGRSASLRSLYKGIFWDPIFTTPPIRLGVRFTKSSGPEWRLIILGKPQKIKEILQLSQVDGFIDVKGRFMNRPYDALSMPRIFSGHPFSNLFGSCYTTLGG